MVVSNDPAMTRLVQHMIQMEGRHTVEMVYDVETAAQMLSGASYQFLIYDTDKPADTGKLQRLVRISRSQSKYCTKTLAITNYDPYDVEYKVFDEAFDGCLSKPFTKCQLMRAMALLTVGF